MSLGLDNDLLYERRLLRESAIGRRTFRGNNALTEAAKFRKDRIRLATETHVPQNKEKYGLTKTNEAAVAEALRGSTSNNQNEPFDVYAGKHAIEVKTINESGYDRVTMHPSSLRTKRRHAKERNLVPHTVVFDTRRGKEAVYYREGLGSFRLNQMRRLPSVESIREALGIEESEPFTDSPARMGSRDALNEHGVKGMKWGQHKDHSRKGRKTKAFPKAAAQVHKHIGQQLKSSDPGILQNAKAKIIKLAKTIAHHYQNLGLIRDAAIDSAGIAMGAKALMNSQQFQHILIRAHELLQPVVMDLIQTGARAITASSESNFLEHGIKGQKWGVHKLDRGAKIKVAGQTVVIEKPKLGYGYFEGHRSSDGGDLDVFVGPKFMNPKDIYVFYTKKEKDGKQIVEPKVMYGFDSKSDAKDAFKQKYDKHRLLFSTYFTPEDFKDALETDELYKPPEARKYKESGLREAGVKGMKWGVRKGAPSVTILMGTNGAGKTTLIKNFVQRYGGEPVEINGQKLTKVTKDGNTALIMGHYTDPRFLAGSASDDNNRPTYKNSGKLRKAGTLYDTIDAAVQQAESMNLKSVILDSHQFAYGKGPKEVADYCKSRGLALQAVRIKAPLDVIVKRVADRIDPGHVRDRTLQDIARQHVRVKSTYNDMEGWKRLKLNNNEHTNPKALAKKMGRFIFKGQSSSESIESMEADRLEEARDNEVLERIYTSLRENKDISLYDSSKRYSGFREHGGDGTILHPLDGNNYIPLIASTGQYRRRPSYAEQVVVSGEVHNNPGSFE